MSYSQLSILSIDNFVRYLRSRSLLRISVLSIPREKTRALLITRRQCLSEGFEPTLQLYRVQIYSTRGSACHNTAFRLCALGLKGQDQLRKRPSCFRSDFLPLFQPLRFSLTSAMFLINFVSSAYVTGVLFLGDT